MRASDLLGPDGPFAESIPGYEHRPAQMAMADAVDEAIRHSGVLLVEAGTGTGKTWAYLVPALLSGKRVIVSTATRNLQDQIATKDVPAVLDALGPILHDAFPERATDPRVTGVGGGGEASPTRRGVCATDPRVTVLKGLANYVCKRRLEIFRRSADARDPRNRRKLPLLDSWLLETELADRAELDTLSEDDPIWPQITSGADTRVGPRCAYYEECFVTKARRRAESAQIIVVNHHLFFADLAMRASAPNAREVGVLPDYDVVIFDEAHRVEDVATLFFGRQISSTKIARLCADAIRAFEAESGLFGSESEELSEGIRFADQVESTAQAFFAELPKPRARAGGGESARYPLEDTDFTEELETRFFALDDALAALQGAARKRQKDHESMAQLIRRSGALRDDLAAVAEGASSDAVAWVSPRGRSVVLGVSPVDVGRSLRDEIWDRKLGVILTSATLTSATRKKKRVDTSVHSPEESPHLSSLEESGFGFVARRLGLDFEVDHVVLPSPFDWPGQAGLYLPRRMPDPRSPRFVPEAGEQVLALDEITGGGAFVLCTSFRHMHGLAQECRPTLVDRERTVLVQGEAPREALLARFRDEGNAVLFATASFWEGVDVPGDALRLVVLDKLPFEVPSDPLVAARCERLEDEGGKPFMELLVPQAALTLKQGFGRLIRSRRDRGVVAILDSRIVNKPYGHVLLRSLPDASRCYSHDEVKAFWDFPLA